MSPCQESYFQEQVPILKWPANFFGMAYPDDMRVLSNPAVCGPNRSRIPTGNYAEKALPFILLRYPPGRPPPAWYGPHPDETRMRCSRSGVDVEIESIILNTVKEYSKDNAVFLITHNLNNLLKTDYLYLLANHQIVQEGSPLELISKDGLFKNLVQLKSNNNEVLANA